jgi:lipopolysaccharide/colanic/teichoic acid biosynthesis glycosyltransferase
MYKHFFKRFFDIVVSFLALPFVLLVVLIMAPIIYINDPGPIFYNATRRGMNGKSFKMFKLRSMYVNSPDIKNADGSTFNGDKDPRVTKIGRIMRKTSIDELPQILNVFLGHMSFIGPRPTLATRSYDEVPMERRKRYEVRPGITGYAQAYYRNSISQQEKFELDAYYVDHLTFAMDVKVFFKTIKSVLVRENIYVTPDAQKSAENAPAATETASADNAAQTDKAEAESAK